jgi:hypothetical protein
MQTKRTRPRVFGGAWLLFAVSLALPAMKGCGSQTSYGWEAAFQSAAMGVETCTRLINGRIAGGWFDISMEWIAFVVILNLPNLMMLVSPWALHRQQQDRGKVLSLFFGCAAACTWYWGLGEGLLIGYYVWSAGITLISLAARPTRSTLGAMLLLSAAALCLQIRNS